ncbi:LysR family transcriptional regulator, partial [Proteus mirabilis]
MDIRDLKLFLHLAESCHFTKTAQAMHVSPSTLSRQIQRLEEQLGPPLFLRDNRQVPLTDVGEALKLYATNTLFPFKHHQHTPNQNNPSFSGGLRLFCSATPPYRPLPA